LVINIQSIHDARSEKHEVTSTLHTIGQAVREDTIFSVFGHELLFPTTSYKPVCHSVCAYRLITLELTL